MSPVLMPTRQDPRQWKDDKIWTEVAVTIGGTRRPQMLHKYYHLVLTVPLPDHWITYEPANAELYALCIGCASLEDHMSVIQSLCQIHEKNRFAFDHLVVIDARKEIIGEDWPEHKHAPHIPMDDVLSGRRLHRVPGDGPEFGLKEASEERVTGTVELTNVPFTAYTVAQVVSGPATSKMLSFLYPTINPNAITDARCFGMFWILLTVSTVRHCAMTVRTTGGGTLRLPN